MFLTLDIVFWRLNKIDIDQSRPVSYVFIYQCHGIRLIFPHIMLLYTPKLFLWAIFWSKFSWILWSPGTLCKEIFRISAGWNGSTPHYGTSQSILLILVRIIIYCLGGYMLVRLMLYKRGFMLEKATWESSFLLGVHKFA